MSEHTPYNEELDRATSSNERRATLFSMQEGYRRRIADEATTSASSTKPPQEWLVKTLAETEDEYITWTLEEKATHLHDAWRTEQDARVEKLVEIVRVVAEESHLESTDPGGCSWCSLQVKAEAAMKGA